MFELFFSTILPIGLILIMVGMGMALDVSAFRELARQPGAALAGVAGQLVLLPLIGIALVWLSGASGAVALGLLLVSACPGGVTSNALTYIARGDVALSVSLTAVNSVAVIFTLPLIMLFGAQISGVAETSRVNVPAGMIMQQLAMLTVVPVSLGMAVRRFFPRFARAAEPSIRAVTIALLVAVFFLLLISEFDFFAGNVRVVGSLVLALMAVTMALAYGLGVVLGLPERQRFTILIEVGIQNTVLAVYVATKVMGDPQLAVVPSTYGIVMLGPVGVLMLLRYRLAHRVA